MSSVIAPRERAPPTQPPASPRAKPLLFLHIPKTAGTSLLTLLGNALGERHVRRLASDELDREAIAALLEAPGMQGVGCLAGHIPVHALAGRLDEFRAFTLLRHPVERVMSLYRFLRQQAPHHAARVGLHENFSFEAFLDCRTPELYGQVRNGMCRMLCDAPEPNDSTRNPFWQERMPLHFVERAVATLQRIDVGLAEDMPGTLALLRAQLNVPFEAAGLRENVTARTGQERTTANLLRLTELNAADLALYHEAAALFRTRTAWVRAVVTSHRGVQATGLVRLERGVARPLCDVTGRQGFHRYEPELAMSWVLGTEQARLAFSAEPGPARLRFSLYHITEAYPVAEIGVTVNGTPVAHRWERADQQWGTLETQPFAAAALNSVALSVPYTLPARYLTPASQDRRQLSIAVATLMLTAA